MNDFQIGATSQYNEKFIKMKRMIPQTQENLCGLQSSTFTEV